MNTDLSGSFKTETNTAVMTERLLLLGFLAVQEYSGLFLKSFFGL
jgi:hypothetical protein